MPRHQTEFCRNCEAAIPEQRRRRMAVYCSMACDRTHKQKLYYENNGKRVDLTAGTTGAIGEMLVSADLLGRGYQVYRALSGAAPVDLAILHEGRLVRVEVTTGYLTAGGKVSCPKPLVSGKYDHLAVVVKRREIHYFPDLPLSPPRDTGGT